MNNDSGFFKLGLFIITGVALIVAGIVVFGAGALFQNYITLETATTGSVEGLTVGAAVKRSGVTIGKVSKIELGMLHYKSDDPVKQADLRRWVVVDIQIDRRNIIAKTSAEMSRNLAGEIERGLRLRMASSGLTGPPFMEAAFLDPQENPPPTLPFVPEELYIPSAPTQMSEIVAGIESIVRQLEKAKVDTVVADLQKLISDTDKSIVNLNSEKLGKDVTALVEDVRGTNHRVHQILDDPKITQGIDDLTATLHDTHQIVAGQQVKAFVDDLPKLSAQLHETIAKIDAIAADPNLKKTLDNLSDTSASAAPAAADLRRVLRKLDALVSSQSEDLQAIMANLRQLLNNGTAITEDAKSNPSRVLFGEPPPHVNPGASK